MSDDEEEDLVCVSTHRPTSDGARLNVVLLPLRTYEARLGMRHPAQLLRQLALDLPRSLVRVEGVRAWDAETVLARCAAPRMCTQAALAPVLEWYQERGILLFEPTPRRPVTVDVCGQTLMVRKRLHAMAADGDGAPMTIMVSLYGDAVEDLLVVELERVQ